MAVQPCGSSFQDVVHISDSDFATPIRGYGPLLIFFERHIIVFNGFSKVSPFVFTCSTGICGIDVIGIDLKHGGKIVNTLFQLAQFFKSAATDIESTRILRVQLHQRVAVLDGLGKAPFL